MSPRDHQPLAPPDPSIHPPHPPVGPIAVERRALPSGRSLVLRAGQEGEELEIRSARGDVDLRITLTDAGPVVTLRSARLEVDGLDVAVRCRDFHVQASGQLRLQGDEVRAEATRDVHLNGEFIRLNCTPEGEAETQALLAQLATTGGPDPRGA